MQVINRTAGANFRLDSIPSPRNVSPIARDTVLVNDPDNPGSFVRKSKLILQCSIADLHGDLYSPTTGLVNDVIDKDGKHLVSDTMFQGLLPPELRVMSNHYKTV